MPHSGIERSSRLTVERIDFDRPEHAAAFLDLLDHYACDAMGGGAPLAAEVRAGLVDALRVLPHYFGALAWAEEGMSTGEQAQGRRMAVGLINCFSAFSTFAAKLLLNVHDLVVRDGWRGAGVGQSLLAFAEASARQQGCCKLTLEVLSNNTIALRAYEKAGFAPYVLDPAAGQALFLQKKL